jgi:AcrR family transcriptional regulator
VSVVTDSALSRQPSKDKPDKAKMILEGALQVFTAQGYSAASMDRIAAAAGVSKSTLYSYFRDKEGLFLALVQEMMLSNRQRIFDLLTNPNLQAPPEQVLRQIATLMLTTFSENKTLLTLLRLIIGESERFPDLARAFVQSISKPLIEQLSLYLASQSQLDLPDPVVAARIFSGSLVHYLMLQNVLHGGDILPCDRDRMIDGLVHTMTRQ